MRNGRNVALLAACALCWSCMQTAAGQTTQEPTERNALSDMKLRMSGLSTPVVQPPGVALETTVDPKHYVVGPSDILALNVWVAPPVNLSLTVTPEGTLIIPFVGEVAVSGLSLADVKEKVTQEVRKKYVSGAITLTLLTPRPIVVTVAGNVLYPGTYTLSAVDRAHRAIEAANAPGRAEIKPDRRLLSTMSTRNVTLRHRDGTSARVDIDKFIATYEDRWNPFLREGDMILVPRKEETRNVVGVYGQVNAPGRYEYVRGDSVKDLLKIGQGFTRLAREDTVEFVRVDQATGDLVSSPLDVRALLRGNEPDLALAPGDRLIVKARQEERGDERATILGEVRFPGTYPITRSGSRLSELVRMAGGFTDRALMGGTTISRRQTGADDPALAWRIGTRGRSAEEDTSYFSGEAMINLHSGLVLTDVSRLFLNNDSTQDVLLQTEDTVRVPRSTGTVFVYGQVRNPGHVPFVRGEDAGYFIARAGGITDEGRSGEVKVIKAGSRQWIPAGETTVGEGDQIWVPRAVERPFGYYLNIVSQAAAVLSVMVSLVLLFQLQK